MSDKHLVCHGATCTCQFGTTPDSLVVKTHSKHYINDSDGQEKLMATHKEIGQPFKKNNFGSCKKLNNNPCKVNLTEWKGFYEKITLQINGGGHPLLEDSQAVCAIAGAPCIKITKHGQTASVSPTQIDSGTAATHAQINPLVDEEALVDDDGNEWNNF